MEAAAFVGIGGAVGAVLRYYVGRWLHHEWVPVGTLTVNVGGSFLLALVSFAALSSETALLVGTGLCGSFTTYSTFSFETVRLWEADRRLHAVGYAVGTLSCCVAATTLAAVLATRLI